MTEEEKKKRRDYAREKYHTDPEYREKQQAYNNKYQAKHPEQIKARQAQWKRTNREYLNAYFRNYAKTKKYRATRVKLHQKKMKEDFTYRFNYRVGHAIYKAIRKEKGGRHWEDLTGYTLSELIKHLESLFTPGMTWDNYGDWHIDHIIPRTLWKYQKPEDREFKQCWALCNLQPLWAWENLRKGAHCT